jgi:hypothetical protein
MLKHVLLNLKDGVTLNWKMLKEGLSIDTTFDPPQFLSDYTFEGTVWSDENWGGQKWYQSLALSLLFSHRYFLFLFIGTLFLKSIKPVSAFNDHKNWLYRINVASAANSL